MDDLLDEMATALMAAEEFFTARDEMNANVHLAEARWSPITLQTRAAIKAWQQYRYPELIDGVGAGSQDPSDEEQQRPLRGSMPSPATDGCQSPTEPYVGRKDVQHDDGTESAVDELTRMAQEDGFYD